MVCVAKIGIILKNAKGLNKKGDRMPNILGNDHLCRGHYRCVSTAVWGGGVHGGLGVAVSETKTIDFRFARRPLVPAEHSCQKVGS